MRPLLITMAALLGALVWTDGCLNRRLEARRARDSAFASLGALHGVEVDRVARLEAAVAKAPRPWRYALKDGKWRSVDYHGAFLEQTRIDSLLSGVLQAPGTLVSGKKRDAYFGLDSEQALKLRFLDGQGKLLLEVWARNRHTNGVSDPSPARFWMPVVEVTSTSSPGLKLRLGVSVTVLPRACKPWGGWSN